MTETKSYKAAAIQFEPTMFEKERNIERLLKLCEEAAEGDARLLVTPEMGTTGYCWYDRAEVEPYVETVPGPTTARFQAVAEKHGCYIVLGMPEVDEATNLYYNTAVLIGPKGIVGKHRKSHPYIAEPKWSASGDTHDVFETDIGRIGLLICMDIHFVETARLEALAGADVICHISNWLAERAPAPYWINRAFENACYVIEANRWGLERTVQFSGGTCVIAPDGAIAASLDTGDGIAYATIDVERARKREVLSEPVFASRRPELYFGLMTNSFTWNPNDFFRLYGYQPIPRGRLSRTAVAQFAPSDIVAANLAQIEALTDAALEGGATDMLVFPELSLTGLGKPATRAEPLGGVAVSGLVRLAMRKRIYLVAGLAERDGDAVYNTAVLAGPEGLVGSYRKTHLGASDKGWATAGDEWKVFDLPFGRLGLAIGHDALYPEAIRSLALLGCDVVACPAAIAGTFTGSHPGTKVPHNYPVPKGADPYHWHAMRVRGGENNVYFAFANVFDPDKGFEGRSAVFGPDTFAFPRQESAILDDEGVAVGTVDTTNLDTPYPTNVVRRKDLVTMRLPHHYQPLIQWHQ